MHCVYVCKYVRQSRNITGDNRLCLKALILTHMCMSKECLFANFDQNRQWPWHHFQGQRFGSRSSCVNILQTMTAWTNVIIVNSESYMWPFDGHICIWPWPILKIKLKVLNSSTANISKIVTDKSNITIAIKYEIAYGLLISIFRFHLVLFWKSTWS